MTNRTKRMVKSVLSLLLCISMMPMPLAHASGPVDGGTVDLTSFAAGDTSSHAHIWEQKSDDTYHWHECRLCHTQQSKAYHTFGEKHTLYEHVPSYACREDNYEYAVCSECGYTYHNYNYAGKPNHKSSDLNDRIVFQCAKEDGYHKVYWEKLCRNCAAQLEHIDTVYDADGSPITNTVGKPYPISSFYKKESDGSLTPLHVEGFYFGTFSGKDPYNPGPTELITTNGVGSVSDIYDVSDNGPIFSNIEGGLYFWTNSNTYDSSKVNLSVTDTKLDDHTAQRVFSVSLDVDHDYIHPQYSYTYFRWIPKASQQLGGWPLYPAMNKQNSNVFIKDTAWQPYISSVAPEYGTTYGGYSQNVSINIAGMAKGTEYIYITVKDPSGTVVVDQRAIQVPDDDNFNVNIPLNGASFNEGDLTVEVKNVHSQVATSTCHVNATDMQGPALDNKYSIDLHTAWSPNKDLLMNFSDAGVGGIQVALNSEDNYISVPDGSIVYHLTGDVLSQKNIIIFAKDALGNVSTFEIPINKFDKTPPTAQSLVYTEDENTQPVVTANATDNSSESLQYQFNDGEWQSSNILNVTNDGSYTVRVKDAAGNVSTEVSTDVTMRKYNVTFYDGDRSTVLQDGQYVYGQEVVEPQTPTKQADVYNTYQFSGWSTPVVNCVGDAQYYAQYTATPIEYTVTFKNWDGTNLKQDNLHYGDAVTEPSGTPTREADLEKTYEFTGWDTTVDPTCVGNKTYTAQYTSTPITYHVKFLNWDGTVIAEADYNYGDTMEVPTPTKDADDEFSYVFTGWSPETTTTCTGSKDYTAQFEPKKNNYTVTFKNWDGYIISSDTYVWNAPIQVPEETPTRADDNEFTYTFSGWSPDVNDVCNGSATYIAQYTKEYIDYTITFNDSDSTEYYKFSCHWGDPVTIPENPTKDSDSIHYYTFSRWNPDVIPYCNGNMVYTAEYATDLVGYDVEFKNWDGSTIKKETLNYGDIITAPENPTRESDERYNYVFDKWSPDIGGSVTGNHTYYALFTPVLRVYTVVFKDWDDTIISSKEYNYGDTVAIPNDPVRGNDGETTYTFTGWGTEPSVTCVGNAVYKANYSTGYVNYTVVFKDWDNTILSTASDYLLGQELNPPTTTRNSDGKFTYEFNGWGDEYTGRVTGNAVYVAQYNSSPIYHGGGGSSGGTKRPPKDVVVSRPGHGNVNVDINVDNNEVIVNIDNLRPGSGDTIHVSNNGDKTIVLPVDRLTPGCVPIIRNPDGTITIIKDATIHDGKLRIPISGNVNFEIIDNSKDFIDMRDHWAKDFVDFLSAREWVAGVSATEFNPNGIVTRGQSATVIYNIDDGSADVYKAIFGDVKNNMWYTKPAEWGHEAGIVKGYQDGNYYPYVNVTREQFITMLWRRSGNVIVKDCISSYEDADSVSGFARNAVNWAVHEGIINGTSANTLSPKSEITRGQMAAMLYNMCNR